MGAEARGIDPALLGSLKAGYDTAVYTPMPGHHTSLNVAAALALALYEYRRQWPEAIGLVSGPYS